ncbi:Nucleic acid-binding, OB-fold-like protein, putative [Theobroma cacao]|uniref:Nucleic acid-binding, OB-fold-like protein, putative n=1 Tax=Theobroma cacao TaxID=3641 RepID=A0A061FF66_THECC|nr:Nucleic acid-binding, OB-fold-like protein, putative [Theobroma cacao]
MATQQSNAATATKPGLRKPVFTKVEQLKPGTSGHTLTVKVLSSNVVLQKGRSVSQHLRQTRIAECLIGDETGSIIFTARNDQGEKRAMGFDGECGDEGFKRLCVNKVVYVDENMDKKVGERNGVWAPGVLLFEIVYHATVKPCPYLNLLVVCPSLPYMVLASGLPFPPLHGACFFSSKYFNQFCEELTYFSSSLNLFYWGKLLAYQIKLDFFVQNLAYTAVLRNMLMLLDATVALVFQLVSVVICIVDLMKPGATVILRNAKIDMFKGSMRLAVDKWGRVEVTEPAKFVVKEDNNLSLVEYELVNVVEE